MVVWFSPCRKGLSGSTDRHGIRDAAAGLLVELMFNADAPAETPTAWQLTETT